MHFNHRSSRFAVFFQRLHRFMHCNTANICHFDGRCLELSCTADSSLPFLPLSSIGSRIPIKCIRKSDGRTLMLDHEVQRSFKHQRETLEFVVSCFSGFRSRIVSEAFNEDFFVSWHADYMFIGMPSQAMCQCDKMQTECGP